MSNESIARRLTEAYLNAREEVIRSGYSDEIDWQDSRDLINITETEFLREGAWVILNSGIREQVIRSRFQEISKIFFYWKSSKEIYLNKNKCYDLGLKVFNNCAKISAIIAMAKRINDTGFDQCKQNILNNGIDYLKTFSHIGPVTSFHLAKNIGLDVAKPDRHLVRFARKFGFDDVNEFCEPIAQMTGDRVSTIDLVFWRYANLNNGDARLFATS